MAPEGPGQDPAVDARTDFHLPGGDDKIAFPPPDLFLEALYTLIPVNFKNMVMEHLKHPST